MKEIIFLIIVNLFPKKYISAGIWINQTVIHAIKKVVITNILSSKFQKESAIIYELIVFQADKLPKISAIITLIKSLER